MRGETAVKPHGQARTPAIARPIDIEGDLDLLAAYAQPAGSE